MLRPLPALAACLLLVPSDSHARYASLVMDARTGEVYRARHADDLRYPASLTKVMTLYMVFEKLESGGWTLDTRLKVSKRAAGQPATRLGLKAGSYLPVRTAIRALVVRSANDVATLIAENHSGSESKFAAAMTMRAREIGMFRTTFRNASGLPNRHQKSTARDMALLAVLVQRHFPQYYHFFKTRTLKYKGRTFKNHNALLKKYSGTDGVKTGYIRASGFNLMSSVRRNGQHLVAVVFGGKTAGRRNRHMVKILDSGFKAASRASAQRVPPLPVTRMRVAPPPPVLGRTRPDRPGSAARVIPGGRDRAAAVTAGNRYCPARRRSGRSAGPLVGPDRRLLECAGGSRRHRCCPAGLRREGGPASLPG